MLQKIDDIRDTKNFDEMIAALKKAGFSYEVETFKNEFTLIFADIEGYFKYSVFVFNKNKNHMAYCDDFELHHDHMKYTKEELKKVYIDTLKNKIFTESELLAPESDYIAQENKLYYIRNYYFANNEYLSAFCIKGTPDEKKLDDELKKGSYTFDPVGFCYITDPEKVKAHADLLQKTKAAFIKDSFEYWLKAFKYEMFNHEYAINWQGDYDVISCFANVPYSEDGEKLLSAAGFNDTQKKAYRAAAKYVYKNTEC